MSDPIDVLDAKLAEVRDRLRDLQARIVEAETERLMAQEAFLIAHGWTRTEPATWVEPGTSGTVAFGIMHAVTIQRRALRPEAKPEGLPGLAGDG